MQVLIEKYKKIRKKGLLTRKYKGKYAFVGVGHHSINNLYPVLNYLQVDLKYIVAKSADTVKLIQQNFQNVEGTDNLDKVLNDNEIKGIFISSNPTSHFSLVKKALEKDKNVFVEKPPCISSAELKELIELEKKSKGTVLVGLQKRYSPVYDILLKKIKTTTYYSLKYHTGAYPEGDEVLDLFIHPLDSLFYLFGKGEVKSIQTIKAKGAAITYLIHIEHDNKVVGNIELSTDYSWTEAKDELSINTPKGIYEVDSTKKLTFHSKPKVVMNIPLEKVKQFIPQTDFLFEQNSFLPIREQNQIYTSGYYHEIESFLCLCENISTTNLSELKTMEFTLEMVELLREQKNK